MTQKENTYDILIVGGGPAGMTAALYALRSGKSACIIDNTGFGGQIVHSPKVENFPGTMEMSGNDFANRMAEQLLNLDADVGIGTVCEIAQDGSYKEIHTEDGSVYRGRTLIIAAGAKHRTLGISGEEQWIGSKMFFCAVCDGPLFKDKSIALIGGGNSALQEAIFLSEICREITIVQDLPDFTGEIKLRGIIATRSNIRSIFGTVVESFIVGGEEFQGLRVSESATGVKTDIACDGFFVAIGLVPENGIFAGWVDLDKQGYIIAEEDCHTKTPGIFVAGDCRSKSVRQLTTAVGDGAMAALAACRYIDQQINGKEI
ncbi:MAG: FAD-dependent oxidoreductase [Spirochaetaceae bacterium]|nr:FAD-dependent oxidoreductase [Spirochaetaceae bacterium]